jgi:hypothetical protein
MQKEEGGEANLKKRRRKNEKERMDGGGSSRTSDFSKTSKPMQRVLMHTVCYPASLPSMCTWFMQEFLSRPGIET